MTKSTGEKRFFGNRSIWPQLFLGLLFIIALAIRVFGINEPPLDFHPVKQYRSALTARAYYYENNDSVPTWKKDIARDALQRIGILVPPIMDSIATGVYLVVGAEYLWIPRLTSALAWIVGGMFLYQIALKFTSQEAALFAVAFYLLLPFGVIASRSFQPDPVMVMMLIISLYAIIQYDHLFTKKRLLVAAVTAGIAIFIKPVSLFIIYGAFVALAFHKDGIRKSLLNRDYWVFGLISLTPTLLYYGYGIFGAGFLEQQAEKSFLPQLLLRFDFWDGWLKRVRIVMGFTYFLAGMIGVFMISHRRFRILMLGMWAGYFVMNFVFTYTVSTHDYYHLPLVPVVALSLTSIASAVLSRLDQVVTSWVWRLAVLVILFVALFLSAGTSIQAQRKLPEFEGDIQIAYEIGDLINHSTKTIHLAPYDGKPLMYYGEFSGNFWPYRYDIRDEKLWGIPEMSVEQRLNLLNPDNSAQYFIVTDLQEFEAQQDLKVFLTSQFSKFAENEDYIIFNLRKK